MGFFDKFKKKVEPKDPIAFSNKWDFYLCKKPDLNYFIRFDISLLNLPEEERAKYPHVIELRVPYERERMDLLNAIEDRFSPGGYDVRLIGALTDNSFRHFVFCYAGTRADTDKIVEKLMGASESVEFYFEVFTDDNWNYYDKILAPNAYERNWMANNHLCRNLEENGEAFEEPREIDFYMYFSSEAHVQDVADKLSEKGFATAARDRAENGEFMLHLTLEAVPAFKYMDELTDEIIDLLDGTDGYFDGWGCPVVRVE